MLTKGEIKLCFYNFTVQNFADILCPTKLFENLIWPVKKSAERNKSQFIIKRLDLRKSND